jgi:tetratricopeptide (TPR) repeat protein
MVAGPPPGASPRIGSLATLALLVFVAHRALVPMEETDLFFHLKLGQLILERHRIPFQNLFSFTYPDHPDPDLSWAFQVLVALLHRIGGFGAIVVAKTALIGAAVALVAAASRAHGAGPLAVLASLALAVVAAEPRFCERPHLITFVGLGALGLWLARGEHRSPPERARAWRWLPLGVWVWANFHAGVFLGPPVVVAYLAGAHLDRRLAGGHPPGTSPDERRAIAWALAASTLACFCTPATYRLPAYLLWHTGLGSTRDIDEFRVADAWNDPWFFMGLALTLMVVIAVGPRRLRWRLALPPLLLAPLAIRSVRFVAEWTLVAAPLWAFGLTRMASGLRLPPRLPAIGAAVAALGLVIATGADRLLRFAAPLGLRPDVVPFDAIDFATRHGLRQRLYSNLDVGCYLLWEGYPRYQVFQDARLPAYPDEFHRALDRTPLEPAAFDALLRRHGVQSALLSDAGVNARAGCFDPDEWALVYLSSDWRRKGAMVFARRTPAHRDVIARFELPFRGRFSFTQGTRLEPIAEPPSRSPLDACTWTRRLIGGLEAEGDTDAAQAAQRRALLRGCLSPDEEAQARFREGARLQLAGRPRAAIVEYDRVLELRPGHLDAQVNRGLAHLTRALRGHREAIPPARRDLQEAARIAPDRADARLGLQRLAELPD